MMRKCLALALCVPFVATAMASVKQNAPMRDSVILLVQASGFQKTVNDTLFMPVVPENPLTSYQNLVYKKRLDSIQKTVPLSYNEHVQKYIDIYAGRKEEIARVIGLSRYYFPVYEKALKQYNIPEEIKFLSVIESALNPHAISRSGATGPWQFMFTTAKAYGLLIDNYVDERKDPVASSYAAAHYFKDAFAELGDWLLAIAAYNCGKGAVTRAIARAGGVADFWAIRPYLPLETRNYVPAFIAITYIMNCYEKHSIIPEQTALSLATDAIPVTRYVPLAAVARAVDLDLKQLSILNPSYKKQIINGSAITPKLLIIPEVAKDAYTALYDVLNKPQADYTEMKVLAADNSSKPAAESPARHRVRRGESLAGIALRYGVEVQDIKVWNNLRSTAVVPGQIIRLASPANTAAVPAKKYLTYKVKQGDTLMGIAEKFDGVSVSEIRTKNGLKGSTLQPGMILRINKG